MKIKFVIFGLILLGFSFLPAHGQKLKMIDSLRFALKYQSKPEDLIRTQLALGTKFYAKSQADSIQHYNSLARGLFPLVDDTTRYLYRLYLNDVYAHSVNGNFKAAISQASKLSEILDVVYNNLPDSVTEVKVDRDSVHLFVAYNAIGDLYRRVGDYEKAYGAFVKAINYSRLIGEKNGVGDGLNNLGILYDLQKDFASAINYYQKAVKLNLELGRSRRFQLGSNYNNLGIVYKNLEKYDSAEYAYEQALVLMKDLGSAYGEAVILDNLGRLYTEQSKYDEAIAFEEKALEIQQRLGAKDQEAIIILNIADNHFAKRNYQLAEKLALQSFQIAEELKQDESIRLISELLTHLYDSIGNYAKAYHFLKIYMEQDQLLKNEEKNEALANLKIRFETEQWENENHLLKSQMQVDQSLIERQQLYIVIAVILIFSVLIVLLIIYRSAVSNSRKKKIIQVQAARLMEQDKFKSQFFANISHDLRTPISLIHGYFTELKEDKDSFYSTKSEQAIRKGLKNVDHLVHLTEEIRDLIVMEEGNIQLNYRKVKIKPYMSLITGLFRSQAESKGLTFDFHCAIDENFQLTLDPDYFEKIVYNLISNAIKFTESGGVKISVKEVKGKIKIEFSDTGKGISFEHISHVFERFYQSPGDGFQLRQGMGIGLFLVKELTELHQGEVAVMSEQGKGSTFTLILPNPNKPEAVFYDPISSGYIEQRTEPVDITSGSSIQMNGLQPNLKTVLVADDHPEVREYIGNQLLDTYNLLNATNGVEALEILDKMKVDLLVTDLMMPLMDGFELLKRVSEKYPDLAVMVVSARTSVLDTEQILGYGVNDFISKPFDKKEFQLRVKNLLASKKSDEFPLFEKDHIKLANNKALDQINSLIKENLSDSRLGIPELMDVLCLSERQTNRVVKALTGMAPGEYIKEYKLLYAETLLKTKEITSATELARIIGYNNVSHFNKAFSNRFGYKPSELIS